MYEFGLANGVDKMIGIMELKRWGQVFASCGCEYVLWPNARVFDPKTPEIVSHAGEITISERELARIRAKTGARPDLLAV